MAIVQTYARTVVRDSWRTRRKSDKQRRGERVIHSCMTSQFFLTGHEPSKTCISVFQMLSYLLASCLKCKPNISYCKIHSFVMGCLKRKHVEQHGMNINLFRNISEFLQFFVLSPLYFSLVLYFINLKSSEKHCKNTSNNYGI